MRVLLVASRWPLPARRGNQVRTVEWLEALAGDEVGLVAPAPPAGSGECGATVFSFRLGAAARLAGLIRAAARGLPLQEGLYDGPAARRALRLALAEGRWDAVVVQMIRCGWALDEVDRLAEAPPVLFDAIDAMGLHFERAAGFSRVPMRYARREEARRCRRREAAIVRRAALTVAVSRRDLEALGVPEGRGAVVPVGARMASVERSPDEPPRLVLTGNLGYRPTVLGATWFAREVWPTLRGRFPDLEWRLAGARPAVAVRRLATLPGVEVTADPPDLAAVLASATVAVAPLAAGSGVPMKVLEAWAAGVPVVAHPWAAAGLEGSGEGVLVAEPREAWVEAIAGLVARPERAAALAERGRALWRAHYAPERVGEAIRAAVHGLVAS